jgi:signal peptidase I
MAIVIVLAWVIVRPQSVVVLGNAMSPTLKDQQLLVVTRAPYLFAGPRRGDIIAFKSGQLPSRVFLFRIVGVPGDRFRIDNHVIELNGDPLREPYLKQPWTSRLPWPPDGREVVVPADHYFVLGDNRDHAADSRQFGYVDRSQIVGVVLGH